MTDPKDQDKSVGDNETFVRLMQAAADDEDLKKKLLAILTLDKFNRRSVLNTFLQEMRLKGAPEDFMEAMASFLDEEVARKALKILKE